MHSPLTPFKSMLLPLTTWWKPRHPKNVQRFQWLTMDSAFYSWIFTLSRSVLCRNKSSVISYFSVRNFCLIQPPFYMKFWVALAACNAVRPDESLFSPVIMLGVISNKSEIRVSAKWCSKYSSNFPLPRWRLPPIMYFSWNARMPMQVTNW